MFVALLLDVFNEFLKLVVEPDDLSTSIIPTAQSLEARHIEQRGRSLEAL